VALLLIASTPLVQAEPGVSGNINLLNQYRFRGIDQTWGRPALQGGLDWSHADGWYAGAWGSNVSQRSYPGGRVELDLYGGYNGQINDDWSYTLGAYAYLYPGANLNQTRCPSAATAAPCADLPKQRYNTLELNAGLSWKWLSYKLSVAATDYFGANSNTGYSQRTRGTQYHDLSATLPLRDGWGVQTHVGHTKIKASLGRHNPSYTDWRVALTKTWEQGWNASIGVVGANNNRLYRPPTGGLSASDQHTLALNRTGVIFQVGKTF